MKKFKVLLCAFALIPFGLYAQDNDGFLGWGDDENLDVQQQQEEWEVTEKDTVDKKTQGKVGDTSLRQGQEEVDIVKTQELTRKKIEQEEIPTVKVCDEFADINKMDSEDFQALGFSANDAQKIIQKREEQGRFNSVEELSQIEGISQSSLAGVKSSLSTAQRQAQEEQAQK